MGRVSGKIALVTGAANGIGRGCAEALAAEGAHVVLTDLQSRSGAVVVEGILAAGGKATYWDQDVTDEASWIATVAKIRDQFGQLDVLVNNAGIGLSGPITEMSLTDFRRQQAVNVEGVFLGTKHALPLMRAGGGGSIINMSSMAGLVATPNLAAYSATKGAVRLFTKSTAMECALLKDGVRCNSVHPGIIETSIWDGLTASVSRKMVKPGANHVDLDALAASAAPLGVKGLPADIAMGVVYLASDESRYVTGSELVIDGGIVAR